MFNAAVRVTRYLAVTCIPPYVNEFAWPMRTSNRLTNRTMPLGTAHSTPEPPNVVIGGCDPVLSRKVSKKWNGNLRYPTLRFGTHGCYWVFAVCGTCILGMLETTLPLSHELSPSTCCVTHIRNFNRSRVNEFCRNFLYGSMNALGILVWNNST